MATPHQSNAADDDNERIIAHHAGSYSMNAPGISPNIFRLAMRYKVSLFLTAMMVSACIGGIFFAIQLNNEKSFLLAAMVFGPSVLIGLISLLFGIYGIGSTRTDWLAVGKGLLTPGIVSRDRTRLFCLANISCADHFVAYGIKATDYEPQHNETEVACSSVFYPSESHPDRYRTFSPTPLWWGTSRQDLIDGCLRRIPTEMWNGLRTRVAAGIDLDDFHMLLLDENFNVTDKVSTRLHPSERDSNPEKLPGEPKKEPSFFSGGVLLTAIILAMLLVCSGISGGVYSFIRMSAKEDADHIAELVRQHPIVQQELGGIDDIDQNFFDSKKRKKVYDVTGPLGKGQIVQTTLLSITTSLRLQTTKGQWDLMDDDFRERERQLKRERR